MTEQGKIVRFNAPVLTEGGSEETREVIRADMEEAGDEDVFRKIHGDLDAAKVDVSEHQIRRTMDELLAEAVAQIESEG